MHLVSAAELARNGVEAESYRLAEEVAELLDRTWRRMIRRRRGRRRSDYVDGYDRRFGRGRAVAAVLMLDSGRLRIAARAPTAAFGAA